MTKLSKTLLEKIESGAVQQHSRAYFIWKKASILFLLILMVLLGIIAWAVVFHFINNLGFLEVVMRSRREALKLLWLGLPFLWLLLFVLAIWGAVLFAQNTKTGYRHNATWWLLLLLIPSMIGGFLLERSKVGQAIDEEFSNRFPGYQNVHQRREQFFLRPEDGFLVGTLDSIATDMALLTDPRGNIWELTFNAAPDITFLDQRVTVMGKRIGRREFFADSVAMFRPDLMPPKPPRRPPPQRGR